MNLIFVGPDCPPGRFREVRGIASASGGGVGADEIVGGRKGAKKSRGGRKRIVLEAHRSEYDRSFLRGKGSSPPPADVVVFFNPGFTCPDYDWSNALSSVDTGTPFLKTTNTELEAFADLRYLVEGGIYL